MSNALPAAMPARVRKLPRDHVGRPVPWFVAWIDGKPDFRVIGAGRIRDAVAQSLCWVCGKPRNPRSLSAFVIGTMCAVNRVAPEPPSHPQCADYSARVCPWLSTPTMARRERGLPDDRVDPGGIAILRNPGVALVWVTRSWRVEDVGNGLLWFLGDPVQVRWYAQGRSATREEVLASIGSGLPILTEMVLAEGAESLAELERQTALALTLVPAVAS